MEGVKWYFCVNPVLMTPCDGFTKTSAISLDHLDIWIQIHNLHVCYAPMIKVLSSEVGDSISSEKCLMALKEISFESESK